MLSKRIFRRNTQIGLGIITRFYPPDFAATGQFVDEIARYLRTQNINVEIFTGQPGYAFSTQSAQPFEADYNLVIQRTSASRILTDRIRGKTINGLLFIIRSILHLFRSARHFDAILFTTEPPYLPIIGYWVHKLLGIPYICLIYDVYPDVAVQLNVVHPRHLLVRLWNWFNYKTWKHAQAVIVLSSTMRDLITARCPEAADKTFVISSWSNPSEVYPIPKHQNWFVNDHQLQDVFTVLYSGNLGRCHDFETIIDAAYHLKDSSVRFVFIGGGAGKPHCMEKVRILGLTNCLFLPYQEKHDLSYSLASADLSLVSIKSGMEGTIAPSKLYGMMAVGRPIAAICEPHSYLTDVMQAAKCGRVIQNGDGQGLAVYIQDLMQNPEHAASMGESARQYFLKHHTLEVIGQQYLNVIHYALGLPLATNSSPIVKVTSETNSGNIHRVNF